MKHLLHQLGLLVLFCLFPHTSVFADYVEIDGLFYKTHTDGTATIKCPSVTTTGNSVIFPEFGHLVLPETIEVKGRSYRVTEMDETVFKECPTITGITFNEGLEVIGDEAFIDCTNLKEVHFCSTLTALGVAVFENTPWLASQPDGLLYAGQVAMLYKGRMPEGTDFVLQDDARHIATSAFYGQKGLATMTLPEGLLTIGSGAFCGCKNMTSISLPSTLTRFGNDCFRDCGQLTAVRIPDQVTEIGSYAFINCEALAEVTLPASLQAIRFEAFENCKSLAAIELPAGVEQIGRNAFAQCPALLQITVLSPVPPVCASENAFTEEQYAQAELTVPAGSLADYQQAKAWKNFKNIREAAVSAVHHVADAAPSFRISGRTLQLTASAAAQGVSVYTLNGQLLYAGHDESVELPAAQVSVVRIGHHAHQVLVP